MDEENNQNIPIEEVNKVIEGSEEEVKEETEGYVDLTEDAAEKELDTMMVPEKTEETESEKPKQEKIDMSLLQFECSGCNFKSYCNLADDTSSPLPEPIKCLNCGKKKSVKKRVFNITINDYKELVKQEETVEETVEEEVAKEE